MIYFVHNQLNVNHKQLACLVLKIHDMFCCFLIHCLLKYIDRVRFAILLLSCSELAKARGIAVSLVVWGGLGIICSAPGVAPCGGAVFTNTCWAFVVGVFSFSCISGVGGGLGGLGPSMVFSAVNLVVAAPGVGVGLVCLGRGVARGALL